MLDSRKVALKVCVMVVEMAVVRVGHSAVRKAIL